MLEAPVLARCPACSERFPVVGGGHLACPFCRAHLEVSVERAAAPIEPLDEASVKNSADLPGTPWEERGRLAGFLLTVWSAIRSPAAFFRGISPAPIGGAPSFALLILAPAILVQACVFLFLHHDRGALDTEEMVRFTGLVLLASMLSIAYLGTFYQLASSMVTGRQVAVQATVRALCFGFAPMVLGIVPVAGFAIGLCWSLLLHAIALRELHGLTSLKSLAVVALPIALVAVKLW